MRRLVILLLVAVLALAAGCPSVTPPATPPDDLGTVQNFSLTERSGRTVTRADVLGKVWVAGFAFTRCNGSCPQISATMARLQSDLADRPDVRLVSFSVDPEHDTPAVLERYAARYHADPDRWLFLTGKRDDVYGVIRDSFHLAVEETQGPERRPGNEVTHSSRLALIDRKGHIRGYFDGRQVDDEGQPVDDVPRLRQQIQLLLEEKP